MDQLVSFYNKRIATQKELLQKVKNQLLTSSILRLSVFLLGSFGVFFFLGNTKLVLGIIIVTIAIFLYLVGKHTDLQYKRDRILALITINETEIQVLNRNFHHLPDGLEYRDDSHYFAQDIDLFGKGSFYQYSNRTALPHGSDLIVALFLSNSIDGISSKQEAVKELSQMPDWRQDFSAVATLVKADATTKTIASWLKGYSTYVPKVMRWIPNIFSLISIVFLDGYFLGLLPGYPIFILLFAGLLLSGIYLKKTSKLASDANRVQSTFQQYQRLVLKIEEVQFNAVILKRKRNTVLSQDQAASNLLKQFSAILGALDQRNNMIFGFLGNGFFLWDLRQGYKLEQWIAQHGSKVEQWFNTIAFFDAYNSMGNFAYNHPGYTYPQLVDSETVLKSTKASHPLLDPKKAVPNDIDILREQFFIITGANMAGKSTFLRTVSLQIVMANMGLPLCADEVQYNPIKLITSMRTTDSLTDDESYFFSELKRLKFIVDEIKTDNYFIVLDEILKGTNSLDKAIGSRKFVEKLVGSKSTGIIATHDLSLCEASADLPQIRNHYFDAEIIDNELHFDYTFKDGVCQNMNASFLLKKMEIVE
ncbi:DNA mismatch repair protein MutS [Arenibacter antarcticus]|uniref:DNA mismatch repair protein MutS n=1 Tax=Arenibacter antarcticus TaxID=2040469 RepID=A0ABW5VE34_9FLAO|nr:DNA mismatch repair protein MutS [Arenibacter sp. H213]MCM4167064.1 DNA mismatch repair protein MutS [Arenibacter sp. H213]